MKKIVLAIAAVMMGGIMMISPVFAETCTITSVLGDKKCDRNPNGEVYRIENGPYNCSCDGGDGGATIDILELVLDIFSVVVGILAVIGITIVGIQYLTAGGSEEKTRKAKRRMLEIIIGIVLYVLLYALLKWVGINPNVDSTKTTASTTTTITKTTTTKTQSKKPSCSSTISGNMQDFKPCSTIAVGTVGTLTDSRDGEVYNVGKLADGKWWLLDNLRLDLSTTRNLTATDTNISTNWTAPAGIASWANVDDAPKINTALKDTTRSYGTGSSKIGVYYNFCAASAGTACSNYSDSTTSDVCPKGWRIPTGGGSEDYGTLYTAYSNNANFREAFHAAISWYIRVNGIVGRDAGDFWAANQCNLTVSTSGQTYYKLCGSRSDFGYSVRCILK